MEEYKVGEVFQLGKIKLIAVDAFYQKHLIVENS